jgi:hypothetical protein
MRTWLNGQTSPEMLYLETKWASLIPFARAADLLKEVLPVGDLVSAETVQRKIIPRITLLMCNFQIMVGRPLFHSMAASAKSRSSRKLLSGTLKI